MCTKLNSDRSCYRGWQRMANELEDEVFEVMAAAAHTTPSDITRRSTEGGELGGKPSRNI
jgi:hypothetical protein